MRYELIIIIIMNECTSSETLAILSSAKTCLDIVHVAAGFDVLSTHCSDTCICDSHKYNVPGASQGKGVQISKH